MLNTLAQMTAAPAAAQGLLGLPLSILVPMLGLPAFWLASFVVYCVRCALFGMDRSARIDQLYVSTWLPRIFLEFGYWMFRIPVALCIALRITPNMITFGSMLLTVAAAVLIGLGHFAVGGWTLLFAFTCDSWDGIVARATNTSSRGGEFFDSTIDRYNDLITFFGYLYYYRDVPWALVIIAPAMVGSTVISYARAKGDAVGVVANQGYMQRHERAVWLGIGTAVAPIVAAYAEAGSQRPLYHLVLFVMGMLAVLTNITAVWRIRVVMHALNSGTAPGHPVKK